MAPFVVIGQQFSTSQNTISLQEILDYMYQEKDIYVAYNPESVYSIPSNPACLESSDITACVIETHQDAFEFIIDSDTRLMIRPRLDEKPTTIEGRITDKDNEEPLAFAHLIAEASGVISVSDEAGYFSIPTDDKNAMTVIVQHINYERKRVVLTRSSDFQKIQLEATPIFIEETEIVAPLPPIQTSVTRHFIKMNGDALGKTISAVTGDALRTLQILPGVSATNDYSSEIRIRGGQTDQSLVLLNQIPMYKTGHYYDIFSIVNDEPIAGMILYKNYLPVEQGDATAGILQLNTKNPIEQSRQLNLDIGLLTSDIYASGAWDERFGLAISGRTTNSNIATGSFSNILSDHLKIRDEDTRPNSEVFNSSIQPALTFQDVTGSLAWRVRENLDLEATYFFAKDNTYLDNTYTISSRNDFGAVDYQYVSEQDWTNQGLGIKSKIEWTPFFSSQLTAYFTSFDRADGTLTSLTRNRPGPNDQLIDQFRFTMTDRIEDHSIQLTQAHQWSESNKFIWGYQFQRVDVGTTIAPRTEFASLNKSSAIHSVFSSVDIQSGERININAGLRASYYSLMDDFYFSPRIQLQWKAQPALTLKSSLGYYNQYLRTIDVIGGNNANKEVWTLAHEGEIPTLNSTLAMIGATWINNLFTLDVELYGSLDNGVVQELIETDDLDPSFSLIAVNPRLFSGEGRRYGVDLMIKKETNRFQSILSYSLSKSEAAFDAFRNGDWLPAADDRRHEFKWYNIVQVSNFDLHLNPVLASGTLQYQPLLGGNRFNTEPYAPLDPYMRVDIGTDYNFSIGNNAAKLGVSIFNLFDHQNIASIRYARLDKFQEQDRATFFTETLSLMDRTFNIRFQLNIK